VVEKVADEHGEVTGGAGTTAGAPFTAEKVKVCPSCNTANAPGATKCRGCGDTLPTGQFSTQDTQPATCPNCNEDRPFLPAITDLPMTDEHGNTIYPRTQDQYHGDCPHCHQSAAEANAALDKLRHGDSSSWGKGASNPGH
jgi:hypothetical protein